MPESEVEVLLIDAQIDCDLLYNRDLALIALLYLIKHLLHGLHLDHIMEDELLLPLEDEHHAGFFLVLEGPQHAETIEELTIDLNGVQDLAVALGVTELNNAEFHCILAVGRDNSALVEPKVMIVNLLHDVIDEEILLELLLEDEDLVLGLDAVVAVHPPDFEVLRQYAGVKVHHNRVIFIYRLDLALKGPKVLLHLQHFEVLLLELLLLLFLLDQIEQGNSGILFLIDATDDLTVMDVLILGDLWKGSADLLIFLLQFSTLDGVVMDLKISGQQKYLLLTQKSNTEDIRVGDRILLHQFVLLQIHIIQHQLLLTFHQKWHLSTIIKKPVVADMQGLDHKGKVLYFRLGEERRGGFLIEFELVADQRVGPGYKDGRVQHWKDDDLKRTFSDVELRCEDTTDLANQVGLRRTDGRQLQSHSLGEQKALLLEIVVDCISYHLIKINCYKCLDPLLDSNYYMQKETEETKTLQPQEEVEKRFYQRLNNFYQEYYLTGLQQMAVNKFIKTQLADKSNPNVEHIRPWILAKINQTHIAPSNPLQKGCPDIIPGLRAKPWWGRQEFPWLQHFQDNYKQIRDELLTLRAQKGFQPYRGPSWISERKAKDGVGNESIDSGQWNVFYLQLHNLKFDYNCEKVPFIMEMIEKHIPNNYHHSFISALTQDSHIMKHYGPTNKKLRFHLPLAGVSGSRMRVGDETRVQEQGKAYVFDDSFEHEAWHEGKETRLILIVDFWHPDLTKQEIKFLTLLTNARFRAEAELSKQDPDKDNFFSIIQSAKQLIQDNEWWVVQQKI